MTITVSDLDKDIKSNITQMVTHALFKKYSTLPSEEKKISDAIHDVREKLDNEVKGYYLSLTEHNVDVNINAEDYRKVYMHLV